MPPTNLRVKLRKGASYGQDFSQWRWEDDESPVFTVKGVLNGCLWCSAPGFGEHGNYGNGAIFVKAEHTYPVTDELPEIKPVGELP